MFVVGVVAGDPGLQVVAVWELVAERYVHVQTRDGQRVFCRVCGVRAESKGRVAVSVRDLPSAGKATRLVWSKRLWRCRACRRSWRERVAEIPPRAVLTERARAEAARQVGQDNRSVAAVARDFGVGWETVMRAVRDTGRELFADQQVFTVQTRPCRAVGVDEKVMNRAAPRRRRTYVTVIVDLARRRTSTWCLDGPRRSSRRGWQPRRRPGGPVWTSCRWTPTPGSGRAGRPRRRTDKRPARGRPVPRREAGQHRHRRCPPPLQQDTTGHRGRSGDPLYGIRRVLLTAAERLTDRGRARIDTALAAGDPFDEVGSTWVAKELTRRVFTALDIFHARA